jgi:hypothetical protein
LELNNTDIYTFIFALYDEGKSGVFAYSKNDGEFIILESSKV